MFDLTVPDNSLSERIRVIIDLCNQLVDDFGEEAFKFSAPISDEEINCWEKENGIQIPSSYKDWLRFTKSAVIRDTTATFYEPKDFIIQNENKSWDVPDECIVIGSIGGWGISVCFNKNTGELMYIDHGEIKNNLSFGNILDWVIHILESSV